MELRHLRYFVAVAEELHFGRGAARLNVAQPALSQQIKHLEEELGVMLLERTRRHVALTEPGRLFLHEARRTLAQAATATAVARRAAAGLVGRLRIGYVDSALWGVLPGVLAAYREQYPAVQLNLLERLPTQQLPALLNGDLDVGIAPPHAVPMGFETTPLSQESVAIALPASHRLASRKHISVADLADDPWVLVPARIPSRLRDLAVAACAAEGFAPRVAQEARQLDALVALVSAGLGVTFVPSSAQRLPRDGVVYRPLRGLHLKFRLVALWRAEHAPPALGTFLEVLRAVAR
ncbi:MAG: LysR substrate-binding protein [Gemmatimonadetes bacterium]|nr:LysR substrate-binding protein [Gemmatimonadota bacterium]